MGESAKEANVDTVGVTYLENSLVEIFQDMELDQKCPLGPLSSCFSLFTTPF